ncbi:MAG: N-acetyl-alpha-D-glucosaminyl L-malate synthase BshA [Calditrichaeota bacterium]|nr:N-acetyl-alpha-D-glucosaminyl L-malate synthase BshA [Calditrichota bacterium]MBT7616840.1 N-acetyl-alpha-D-glucosaminyl L-malate synthase BshA [Calditrichota bacterium]MBT7788552.1 N-acetyl-alpha-D-glucosaminyl L-malate synthase BshA [Calditrichota bacterium]
MKIGITCYPTFGGSGVVASELGLALAERGHDIHFITYKMPGRLRFNSQTIQFHEVKVPEYPLFEFPPYSLALASRISDVVKEHKLDIIHAHYAIPHAASALLARDMLGGKIKVMTTLHGTDVTLVGREASFMPITRYAIESSDSVTAVSNYLKKEICSVFDCKREIKVIYNFIKPSIHSTAESDQIRNEFAPNNEKLLVHISNYRPIKRINDVFEVFRELHKRLKVRIMLIGEGPELPVFMKSAAKAGIDGDVILLGNRSTVEEILAAADLMIMPSESESFGLAALEAMASGTPPITSNAGGLPEVILDGETGCTVPIGDVALMVSKAYNLLTNDTELATMSHRAREWAFNKFNIGKAIDQYEQYYYKTLNPR